MALIGVLPIGKLFKAAEAIALIGRILPKAAAFFTRHQDDIKLVEKFAGSGKCNPTSGSLRVLASNQAPTIVTGTYRSKNSGAQLTAHPMGSFNYCPVPNINPGIVHPQAGKAYTGQWAEYAMDAYNVPKRQIEIALPNGKTQIRYPDLSDAANPKNFGEIKNVGYQYFSTQIRQTMEAVISNGGTYTLWIRKDTTLSKPLQKAIADNPNFNVDYLPYALDGTPYP